QGAETGRVNLPSVDQLRGNFGPGVLTGAVDLNPTPCAGCVDWAARLTERLGYAVTSGEPYDFGPNPAAGFPKGCTSTADCVFPGGVIPQSAWSPAAKGILPYIPTPNIDPSGGIYSDNSGRNRVTDNKIGERVDFNNRKTGNWSFYYHF